MMAPHFVRFQCNTVTLRWRGYCTCGWERFGERMEVQGMAATHDLEEWLDVDPAQPAEARP